MTHTHTFVFMQVSERTFEEIKQKLRDASYHHAIFEDYKRGTALDLNGIALCRPDLPHGEKPKVPKPERRNK